MMQVVERNVDTIDGEKVVRMEDTQVSTRGFCMTCRLTCQDGVGPAHVPARPQLPRQSIWRHSHATCLVRPIAMPVSCGLTPSSELCFTNAALFAAQPLRFLSLDQINFRLPVPIGAVLRLTSKIVHTTLPHKGPDGDAKVHIMVRAEVEEVETGVSRSRASERVGADKDRSGRRPTRSSSPWRGKMASRWGERSCRRRTPRQCTILRASGGYKLATR